MNNSNNDYKDNNNTKAHTSSSSSTNPNPNPNPLRRNPYNPRWSNRPHLESSPFLFIDDVTFTYFIYMYPMQVSSLPYPESPSPLVLFTPGRRRRRWRGG